MKNSTDRRIFLPTLLLAFFVAFSSSVWAETSQATDVELQAGSSAIWKNGIGSGFRKGTRNLGFALGSGLGLEIFGSNKSHDLALAFGHYGWILSDLLAEDNWYQGNFEVRGNFFAGGQFNPHGRYVVGYSVGPRYNFITNSPWVPYVGGAVGLSATDIREDELSTTFEFNVQIGFGTHYFFREDVSMTMEVRGFHLSNAGIERPNQGTNTVMFLIGTSWFF
jgi:hypothetical protein